MGRSPKQSTRFCLNRNAVLWATLPLLALLMAPFAWAAANDGTGPRGAQPPSEIRKESQKGPVRVRVIADKDTLTIAQELTLTIEAEADEDYDVDLPAFGDKLGEFGIVDYRQEPPVLTGKGRILTRKVYRLEPFLSGDYKIAPMTVTFRKKSAEGNPKDDPSEHEITTEELTVKVRSLLGEDRSKLNLHPIFGPVDLPTQPIPLWVILAGLAVAALGGAGIFYGLKRRGKQATEINSTIPAHEIAYGQLQELLDAGLLDRGEFKAFFGRISDVVRYYIENRFGLHAPKLTTEEFLSSISRNPPFEPDRRRLLDDFLRHCDLVKFAEHRPEPDEIPKTVDACKAFIEATKADMVQQ